MTPFHLVETSLWPALMRITLPTTMVVGLLITRGWSSVELVFALLVTTFTLAAWLRDVAREGAMQGHHPRAVEEGLKKGFMLFITSEVAFFFRFFWGFFHSSLQPTIELGSRWPPTQLLFLDPLGIPLLNTVILLSRGILVTWSHHGMLSADKPASAFRLGLGLGLGVIFTTLQVNEYHQASFTIIDRTIGTYFFVMTGFHGAHVLIGTLFIAAIAARLIIHQFSPNHHAGFEIRAWYWHFVDVVWIYLFIFIYIWGSSSL